MLRLLLEDLLEALLFERLLDSDFFLFLFLRLALELALLEQLRLDLGRPGAARRRFRALRESLDSEPSAVAASESCSFLRGFSPRQRRSLLP
mmetsp:Transcript_48902/g.126092  ORF Transcript_48902/g.126092 Transcript_48902/m.126092 type:complete len:92 (-) Transcript_48902:596-871(-)